MIIDADLQDPPELIPELLAKWREGFEVVYAVRAEREGETWFKRLTASVFYRLIYRITDVKIPLDVGDFRLLDRQVVDTLKRMRERHRFPRGMSAWVGFRRPGSTKRAPHGRRHQVPFPQDAAAGGQCRNRVLVLPPAAGDLLRICAVPD